MNKTFCACAILLTSTVLAGREARAAVVVFDFDNLEASKEGRMTFLEMESRGVRATITRPGSKFDVTDNATEPEWVKPSFFGARTLSPFADYQNPAPFIVTFSEPVSRVSLMLGDCGEDADTVKLEAFAGVEATGAPLAMAAADLPAKTNREFDLRELVVAAPEIRSIRFVGGGAEYSHSIYYDVLQIETKTPEPTKPTSSGN